MNYLFSKILIVFLYFGSMAVQAVQPGAISSSLRMRGSVTVQDIDRAVNADWLTAQDAALIKTLLFDESLLTRVKAYEEDQRAENPLRQRLENKFLTLSAEAQAFWAKLKVALGEALRPVVAAANRGQVVGGRSLPQRTESSGWLYGLWQKITGCCRQPMAQQKTPVPGAVTPMHVPSQPQLSQEEKARAMRLKRLEPSATVKPGAVKPITPPVMQQSKGSVQTPASSSAEAARLAAVQAAAEAERIERKEIVRSCVEALRTAVTAGNNEEAQAALAALQSITKTAVEPWRIKVASGAEKTLLDLAIEKINAEPTRDDWQSLAALLLAGATNEFIASTIKKIDKTDIREAVATLVVTQEVEQKGKKEAASPVLTEAQNHALVELNRAVNEGRVDEVKVALAKAKELAISDVVFQEDATLQTPVPLLNASLLKFVEDTGSDELELKDREQIAHLLLAAVPAAYVDSTRDLLNQLLKASEYSTNLHALFERLLAGFNERFGAREVVEPIEVGDFPPLPVPSAARAHNLTEARQQTQEALAKLLSASAAHRAGGATTGTVKKP